MSLCDYLGIRILESVQYGTFKKNLNSIFYKVPTAHEILRIYDEPKYDLTAYVNLQKTEYLSDKNPQ